MPVRKDPLEREAQRVLQTLLGGSVVERDVPPAQGLRDFDLVDEGNIVQHAVEVTSVQLPAVRAARASMEGLRDTDLALTESWSVTVHESADLRPVRKGVPSVLNKLTARGIERFDSGQRHADGEVEALIQQLEAVGVVQGVALPALQPPRLRPSGYGSGSVDPSNVTRTVEAELEKPDNRRKLAAAPSGATRHAFVWLHDSHWYVSSTLRDSTFPLPPAPLLPPEVDVAWVAVAEGSPPTVSALLRVNASGIAALDPITGAEQPLPQTNAVEGPPSQPSSCPGCSSPGKWVMTRRARIDLTTGTRTVAAAWDAVCSADATHYRHPGRPLSKRERKELGDPT